MGGACSMYGGEKRCIQGLMEKPKRKRPPGRPRRRWEDNIKMDLQEVGCWGVAQEMDRWRTLVNSVMNLRVP